MMHKAFGPNQRTAAPAVVVASDNIETHMVRLFGSPFAIAALAVLISLAGCVKEPQSRATVMRELDSGYTSSNGGGQRYLGNQVNEMITTRVQ